MKIASCQIVAAMTLPRGKAAFDRANVVVRSRGAPGEYLQVSAYVGLDELEGKALEKRDLDALVRAEQAIFLETPLDAASGAAFWVLRANFAGREAALEELRSSGTLLRDHILLIDGSFGCLVREQPAAHDLRDRWAADASRQAVAWARDGHWERARDAASRAFVVERSMSPERIAMLALTCDRMGNAVRAGGYVQMARKSRGDDFAGQVIQKRADLELQMEAEVPRSQTRPARAADMHAMNDNAIGGGLRRLRRKA